MKLAPGAHSTFITAAHEMHTSFLKPSLLPGEYTAQLQPLLVHIGRIKRNNQTLAALITGTHLTRLSPDLPAVTREHCESRWALQTKHGCIYI